MKQMTFRERFRKIFQDGKTLSEQEQNVLMESMLFMRDDIELGLAEDIIKAWEMKICGIIQFLLACGKINDIQEEDLMMLLNDMEEWEWNQE